MPYYLAIDVGGTKADFALADDRRVLARARAGSIKRMRVDEQTAELNLETGLNDLAAQSGVNLHDVACTCIGTAGETVALVTDWLRREVPRRVGGELLILGDVEIALDAAFPGGAGILVLAGTGSNVAGRTAQGRIATAGGWGPVLADQGSGHRIGVEALRAVCLAKDEGRANNLLDAVLGFWKLGTFNDLVAYANATPAPDYSQLVRVIVECADGGDAVAQAVLEQQGRELAYLVCLLIGRMRGESDDAGSGISLAFAGSIMENVPRVRDALIEAVRERYPEVVAAAGVVDPLDGAVWRARRGH